MKIYGSVLLENIPQLIFQALYAATSEFTSTLLFASVASLLSVFAAVLSYFINRDHNDVNMEAIQYYLSLECNRTVDHQNTLESPSTSMSTTVGSRIRGEIRFAEKSKIEQYRGLRLKLSRSLTQFWRIPDKTIEIGATVLTKTGNVMVSCLVRLKGFSEFRDVFGRFLVILACSGTCQSTLTYLLVLTL